MGAQKPLTVSDRKSTKRCREVQTSLVLPFMAFMAFMVNASLVVVPLACVTDSQTFWPRE